MKRLSCVAVVGTLLLGGGCAFEGADGAVAGLRTTDQCSVVGLGLQDTGDSFSGNVAAAPGGPVGEWTHHSGADVYLASPDFLLCTINGIKRARFGGSATVNGVPGYTYDVAIEDRGTPGPPEEVEGPPENRTVTASRSYRPSRWDDGVIAERVVVQVPAELPVIEGNAGNQWANLTLYRTATLDRVVCRYRGGASVPNPTEPADVAAGLSYHLERCTGDDGSSVAAGDYVDVLSLELHVQNGSSTCPSRSGAVTTIAVDLEVAPFIVREPDLDQYTIFVTGPDGVVLDRSGDVTLGDIVVTSYE